MARQLMLGGKVSKGPDLYRKAKSRIPGGTQLLSKRPEMFLPDLWPSYYSKAQGTQVWDLEGRQFTDMSYNGIGACIFGYADPDIDGAVKAAIDSGVASTLNCPEEVELAELLCELHPWAEMVRYTRSGGEAMAVAVRIARAAAGRDRVAFSGYHGWHDWYISANLAEESALDGHLLPGLDPAGVPRALLGTSLPFRYNNLEELNDIANQYGSEIGVIVIESLRDAEPAIGFLQGVRDIAAKLGAVLIIDEITAGFRLNTGGTHLLYQIEPDIAVFAKAISNGYAMAAVIGRSEVMQAAQSTFISSTNWTERVGPAAALKTICKHRDVNAPAHLKHVGSLVQDGWKAAAQHAGLSVHVGGMLPLGHFAIEHEKSRAAHTLFTQLMLERGYLATKAFYATYAHRPAEIESYLAEVEEVFSIIAEALRADRVEAMLRGPIAHAGFHRLT